MTLQEWAAFSAVGVAALFLGFRFFRSYVAEPLSRHLLKHNRVSAAIWVKKQTRSECADCGSCGPNNKTKA